MIATAFSRTPTSPPSVVFQLGKVLINGIVAESIASARRYDIRLATDDDHPMFKDDRLDALRAGCKWFQHITITRLADGRKWLFAPDRSLPGGFINSDAHAEARLAALARQEVLYPIRRRRWY
jgi:hypothetical protein